MSNRPSRLKLAPSVDIAEMTKGRVAADIQPAAPDKPADLHPVLDQAWDELVPQIAEVGLVARSDGTVVEMMLMHYLVARNAFADLLDEGLITTYSDETLKKHPGDSIMRMHSDQFLKYADRLGLTFVSRASRASTPMQRSGGSRGREANPFASAL